MSTSPLYVVSRLRFRIMLIFKLVGELAHLSSVAVVTGAWRYSRVDGTAYLTPLETHSHLSPEHSVKG